MKPDVGVWPVTVDGPDGTFPVGFAEAASSFGRYRAATPPPEYVKAAVSALYEACVELDVPFARLAFVEMIGPAPSVGPGPSLAFSGFTAYEWPNVAFVVTNWTSPGHVREVVRHETYHLAYSASHTGDQDPHSGPSEAGAIRFERPANS